MSRDLYRLTRAALIVAAAVIPFVVGVVADLSLPLGARTGGFAILGGFVGIFAAIMAWLGLL